MTKTELVKAAAMEAGITQADAGRVIDCLVRGISAAVQKDGASSPAPWAAPT